MKLRRTKLSFVRTVTTMLHLFPSIMTLGERMTHCWYNNGDSLATEGEQKESSRHPCVTGGGEMRIGERHQICTFNSSMSFGLHILDF
jgi:hypothetical protein